MIRPIAVILLAMAIAACGSGGPVGVASSSSSTGRPQTSAQLAIVEPGVNATVRGPDVTVQLHLTSAQIVQQTTTSIRADQGHVHVMLDGETVSMAFQETDTLHNLKPGPHSLLAEFVAADHAPFANRVIATCLLPSREVGAVDLTGTIRL